MNRSLVLSLIGALVCSLAACQSSNDNTESATPPKGIVWSQTDTLPYPVLADFAELTPVFDIHNDTTYVINFWATWCAPCVEELPYFEQLATSHQGEAVRFVMVSLDFKREVRKKLYRFVKERPFTLPVVALTDTKTNIWIDLVDPNWSGAIPITIIRKNDKRLFIAEQFDSYQDLEDAFKQIH